MPVWTASCIPNSSVANHPSSIFDTLEPLLVFFIPWNLIYEHKVA
jgi:hypothetical protein